MPIQHSRRLPERQKCSGRSSWPELTIKLLGGGTWSSGYKKRLEFERLSVRIQFEHPTTDTMSSPTTLKHFNPMIVFERLSVRIQFEHPTTDAMSSSTTLKHFNPMIQSDTCHLTNLTTDGMYFKLLHISILLFF